MVVARKARALYLQRVEDAVAEIGRIANEVAPRPSDGRLAGYGVVTRIPTARRRLGAALAALGRTDRPSSLPQCEELARGSSRIFFNQVVGAVFSATDEIARTLEMQTGP